MTRIEQIEAELKAATPGPWYARENDLIGGYCVMSVDAPLSEAHLSSLADFVREADAAFITNAPAHIDAMLPVVKAALALEEANCALQTEFDKAGVADQWQELFDAREDAFKAQVAAVRAFKESCL